jgi:uncharacterized protein (TIGR00369 family)
MMDGRRAPPPSAQLLGWKLESIDPERGTIRVQFEARPEFLNPAGTIQGGLLTAMLDDTMGPAAMAALDGALAQTLELKTSFLRPARPGTLHGEARIVYRGRDIVFLEGTLSDDAGLVVAIASATARIVPLPGGA